MQNILVTGAGGQLGKEIQEYVQSIAVDPKICWFFADRETLDIVDEDAVSDYFEEFEISYCINCAAYTGVDKAEEDKEKCTLINSRAPKFLAKSCQENNGIFIYISSDYVFDGAKVTPYTETDSTNPVNFYGETKLDGELNAIENCKKSIIIRTSWLYSKKYGKNFYKTIQRLGSEKNSLDVVCDQIGTPTDAKNLAKHIVDIVITKNNNQYGIHHFAGKKICSWADFAKTIIRENNLKCIINPIPTIQYPTPAKRPAYSALATTKD
jgi:dTDP-4-dehydrorhamnose reductase